MGALRGSSPILRLVAASALLAACACSERDSGTVQGYVEGEFVHIASPVGGRLEHLLVQRGSQVEAGTPLYELDSREETAAKLEAEARVGAAEAQLEDLRKGQRTPELDVAKAELAQAIVIENQSAVFLARLRAQFDSGIVSQNDLDTATAKHATDAERVRELTSRLEVARLPARTDQIEAQEAQASAARAAVEQADWRLDQKRRVASEAGLVFDTLYREGEWVPANSPVVRMLPPTNLKVRFFVSETVAGGIQTGRKVTVRCDGCDDDVPAVVSYVSPEAEYTPPVIYSNETRDKLVFMVEARPSLEDSSRLRPGQPVEVLLR